MVEAAVLGILAPLLERLALHQPRKCEQPTDKCDRGLITPVLGKLDNDRSLLPDAAVYDCQCGWKRTDPLRGGR